MPYGIIKIDTVTFTDAGVDKSISISGLVQNPTFSGNVTVTGTISGNLVQGQTVSGVTVTGTTATFGTGTFTSLTGTTSQGTTATYTSGSFTSLTGVTTSGTTANFVSGVFSTQLSGATITGNTGNFTTFTAGTANLTSGVFASGTQGAPSISVGTATNGLYSPGTNQVAISTNSLQRLAVDANGNINIDSGGVYYDAVNNRLAVGTTSPSALLHASSSSTDTVAIQVTNTQSSISGFISATSTSYNFAGVTGSRTWLGSQNGVTIGPWDTNTDIRFVNSGSEKARIDSSGRLLVGTSSDSGGALLQVNGDRIRVGTAKTPASATATGTAGEICWDASYVYVCTATNTWKRSALSTW